MTYKDKNKTMKLLKELLKTISIAPVSGAEIYRAIDLNWNDFEDAVQYSTGEYIKANYIISRDTSGYTDNIIPVIQPVDFLAIINQ